VLHVKIILAFQPEPQTLFGNPVYSQNVRPVYCKKIERCHLQRNPDFIGTDERFNIPAAAVMA